MNQNLNKKDFLLRVKEIWEKGDLAGFEAAYSPQMTGHFNTLAIDYADIKNRFLYVAKHHINRKYQIKELMTEGEKALMLYCYTGYDTKLKEEVVAPAIWLFTIQNHQIIHAEIITSFQMDYKAQA